MTGESNSLFVELVKQVPNMVIMVMIVYLFLQYEEKRDEKRTQNAKAMEQERSDNVKEFEEMRQKHESEINAMWASAIKSLVEEQNRTAAEISRALAEHERASRERYERMKITQDLLQVAKDNLRK